MDPWLNEYERLTQQASEISADIKEVHAVVCFYSNLARKTYKK